MRSLVGRKCGMTRVFNEDGTTIPVTVVHVEPNVVTQLKTLDKEGYTAIQVSTGPIKQGRVDKAMAGHFAKANVTPGRIMWEFRLADATALQNYQLAQALKVDLFQEGDQVDVMGITKGRGFAGTVKRHHFRTQDATHGNSRSHRVPGSTGQNQTPGRVFKGKKMAGHMGCERRTIQALQVIKVDLDKNLLLIKGSIPGAKGGNVLISTSVKA